MTLLLTAQSGQRRASEPWRHARDSSPAAEKTLFLSVGATVALLGYLFLIWLTSRGVSARTAEFAQAVLTLQLSFLGNDRLTYRHRNSRAHTPWRTRWIRYQSGRVLVTLVVVALFVPAEAALGHHIAYWATLAIGMVGNYLSDRTLSHRRRAGAPTSSWAADHKRAYAITTMAVGIAALVLVCTTFPNLSIFVISIAMSLASATTLAFQLYSWRTPEAAQEDEHLAVDAAGLRMVVFLAARREASVLGATLHRMVRMAHPNYVVWVVIDHRDDHDTLEIARAYETEYPHLVRVVPYPDVSISSKPIALNEAMRLLEASGEPWDVVGVADAEDRFHVDLLTTVDHLFRERGPGIVQGAVQLINYSVRSSGHHVPDGYLVAATRRLLSLRARMRGEGDVVIPRYVRRLDHTGRLRRRVQHLMSGWWRAANCLEYFKWFSSRLKLQAAIRVMPLGGNTVFFSREFMTALHQRNGEWWDETCLTEDCKIGILASVMGYPIEVFSLPQMATLEETPASLPKFIRQRVRWMQGFIQVFFEGEWRHLPTVGQRIMAVYVLGFQFFQAFAGVFAPIGLGLAFHHKAPTPIVLLALVPFLIGVWTVAIDLLMLHDFGDAYDQRVDPRARHRNRSLRNQVTVADYVGVAAGSYFFQVILALSALGAIYRGLAGITNWVKTDHSGTHLAVDIREHQALGV